MSTRFHDFLDMSGIYVESQVSKLLNSDQKGYIQITRYVQEVTPPLLVMVKAVEPQSIWQECLLI